MRRCPRPIGVIAVILFLVAEVAPACAEVVGVELDRREPFAGGHAFGSRGAYEKLTGRLRFEIDPLSAANRRIVDVGLAPRNERGRVEFASDFFLLRPADATWGNRRILFGVANRGNKLLLGAFNDQGGNDPTTLADAGNGFLMREGYTILWVAWNGDVLPGDGRMVMELPIAREANGEPITGKIYAEICVDAPSNCEPFSPGNSNVDPVTPAGRAAASLTMRPDREHPAVEVPRSQWAFARVEDGKPVPDARHLYLRDGFRPGWLYELVYEGSGPRVTGLGLAAVRDGVSFFRYRPADAAGPANPLAGTIDRAYGFGISQSARLLQHLIYEGFNADTEGRIVFDGLMPHVAGGGKGFFNHRFAQTTRYGSQQEDNLYPCDFFPFTSTAQKDPLTGRHGDSLAASRRSGTLPKVFLTQTSAEYWCRAASLLHTDVQGRRDLPLGPNVRLYFIAGAQHVVSSSPDRGIYQYPRNTLDHRPVLRALLVALDRWASQSEEPPASTYPKIADGTLVEFATYHTQFPKMPGVALPQGPYAPFRLDFGPRWLTEGIIDFAPPKTGPRYATLVPAVDRNGNAVAGIRLPEVAVPLSTYTGWNLRGSHCGAEGKLARFYGSSFPFVPTESQRRESGDPRPAILERYPDRDDYVARVHEAAAALRRQRFLLDEDVGRIEAAASRQSFWKKVPATATP